MKKLMVFSMTAAVVAGALLAAPTKKAAKAVVDDDADEATTGKEAKIRIEQFPRFGRACRMAAPSVAGGSIVGKCFQKPREWIVLEARYQTYVKWQDQLTFTWHVLLETRTATEKSKADREKLPPYSYFTTSVTYSNIPRGGHAASVCLHPSYLERFGEAKAVGLVVTNAKGEELAGDCESEINGIEPHKKFWENREIMDAPNKNRPGEPMIERRQGLLDRSKTIWALVNPNDYELVM